MTRTDNLTILRHAEDEAKSLLQAIDSENFGAAKTLADGLWRRGVQSLQTLSPRGTLRFAAGDRWDTNLTDQILSRLSHKTLPKELVGPLVRALGLWAGSAAVPVIRRIVREPTSRKVISGENSSLENALYAVHLIGGPEAAAILREFQSERVPQDVRVMASRYLNELGSPMIDPVFGIERYPEPESAEAARQRDQLQDPYDWGSTSTALLQYLFELGDEYYGAIPRQELGIIESTNTNDEKSQRVLEPTLPRFMIRLQPDEVMTLRPVSVFFSEQDPSSLTTKLDDWLILEFAPSSLKGLSQLAMFEGAASEGHDTQRFSRALRSWTSELVSLAQYFGKHLQPRLVLSMAAMQFQIHNVLRLEPRIEFAELVRSMFRSLPSVE